jgi:hypothetical protein
MKVRERCREKNVHATLGMHVVLHVRDQVRVHFLSRNLDEKKERAGRVYSLLHQYTRPALFDSLAGSCGLWRATNRCAVRNIQRLRVRPPEGGLRQMHAP